MSSVYERWPAKLGTRANVGGQACIWADGYVGPGVSLGKGTVVGTRAVVVKDVGPWEIVAGNPAQPTGNRVIKHGD